MAEASELAASSSGPRRAASVFVRRVLPPAAIVVIGGVIWQLVALHNADAIPTLNQIAAELGDHPGEYIANGAITLEEMAVGLSLSVAVAFLLALLMTEVSFLERAIMPIAVAINVTPVVSFAPGLVIVFGFGLLPRFVVAAIVVFFPFLVNTLVGLRSTDRDALDFLRTVYASRVEVLWRLRLPGALPFIFAAARICVPLALVGAVVAEFTASGSTGGLGSAIEIANEQTQLPVIYAAVFCLTVIGLVLSGIVVLIERRVLTWHPSGSRAS